MDPAECSCLKIEAVTPPVQHAEGPHWDKENQVLYYVDTFKATVLRYPLGDPCKITAHKLDERDSVGVIVPIKGKANNFIVAADRYVYTFEWDGSQNQTGKATQLHMVDEDKPKNQFNDGKADSKGRLWIGTLTRERKDQSVPSEGGSLFRFDYGKKVTEMVKKTSISNGVAWSSDNKKFYYCDSATKKIVVYDFNLETGELGESKVLFDVADYKKLGGIPDGLSIDDDDNLWIALHGGHGVIQVNGKTGTLMRNVRLPATYVTSTCFGGPNRDILFVTTSNFKLDAEGKKREPKAGSVFTVKGLGVKGPLPYDAVIN